MSKENCKKPEAVMNLKHISKLSNLNFFRVLQVSIQIYDAINLSKNENFREICSFSSCIVYSTY